MEPLLFSDVLTKIIGEDATQTLKCSICLEYFDKPVVLICGHTFCLSCIQDTANYILCQNAHLPPWKVFVNCPECRRPCNASKITKKVNSIPNNYPLASLLDALGNVMIPLKIDAASNTDNLEKSQEEIGTQTTDDPEPDVTHDYSTKELDDIEHAIVKLCISENIANSDTCNVMSMSRVFEKGHDIFSSKKQNKNGKILKQKTKAQIPEGLDNGSYVEYSKITTDFPILNTNPPAVDITDFTSDLDVLRYYNALS